MVRRCATTILAAGLTEVVVVVGHQAAAVTAALAGLPVQAVEHPAFAEGQAGSVRAGLAAIPSDSGATLIALADMPWLTPEDLQWLLASYRSAQQPIALPCRGEQRGNPVVISSEIRDQVLSGDAAVSCRRYIDSHPALVARIEAPNAHFFHDIDNADDYRLFCVDGFDE